MLAQMLAAAVPAMAAVALGAPGAGANWFFFVMGALLLRYLLAGSRVRFVCLFAGTIPVAMLLRGFFYFHSINVILAAGLLLWFATGWDEFRRAWRNRAFSAFMAGCVLYWWISWLRTGSYTANFRALELALSAAFVVLLANYRSYLATALVGIALSTLAAAVGLLRYGGRLGTAEIGEESLGNPISLGLPAALAVLLLAAHNGRWLLADRRPLWRSMLLLAMAGCLLLSTSRGSWLVAGGGMAAIAVFTRGRASLVWPVVVLAAAIALVLATGRGALVREYFVRVASSERTLAQRTTGRSAQWKAAPRIVADAPVLGHGPGSGTAVHYTYTGSAKSWHSLYLQVAVETGLTGLLLVATLLGALCARGARHLRLTGDAVPLAATLGFICIGLTVSGLDAISGVFLGLGFLALAFPGVYVVREVVVAAPAAA